MRSHIRSLFASSLLFASIVPTSIAANPATADSLPHWKKVWADEFNNNGVPDPAVWGYELGYVRNNELQYYTNDPKNVVDTAGNLRIRMLRESKGGKNWTSASVITQGKKTFQFGRIEVRAKLPPGNGSWPAIWTLGINGIWPANGEIDIMEYDRNQWTNDTDLVHPFRVCGTGHWSDLSNKHVASTLDFRLDDPTRAFHNYALEWDSTTLRWFVDDMQYSVLDISAKDFDEFRQPNYLLLNLALDQGAMNPGRDTMDYLVDYVRYYQLDPTVARHRPPVATFDYVNRAYAKDTTVFSVSVKTDSLPGHPLVYNWEPAQVSRPFGIVSPTKAKTGLVFPKGGSYVIWCTVGDGQYAHRAALMYLVGIESAVASPASGGFKDSLVIQLSNTDPKSVIHYTLDGTDPDANSRIYTAPLVLRATTTLKTYSVDTGGLPPSKITTHTYTKGTASLAGEVVPRSPRIQSDASGIQVRMDSNGAGFTTSIRRLDGRLVDQATCTGTSWRSRAIGSGVFLVSVRGQGVLSTDMRVVR